MRGKQAAPLVRVAANQAYQICFALDAGARGIVVPMVNTSAEAEAAVRAGRYLPLGNRSNAGVRGEWGEFKNYRDYLDTVNNGLVIVPMIETNQSLENLDAIASVPGVDVLLIGPSDLSIELGVPLDYQCDIYQRALDKIAAAAAKHVVAAGMYFIPPEMDPNFFVQKGFKFFTMPWGPWATAGIQNGRFLTNGLKLKVNEAKSAVARPEERKFLGFSISNDGSERRIAPKALEKFQMRVRELTRRTRGESLPQIVELLRPYLIGWRSYFGFCQTPVVLTNLEAWIRRRLRMYLWRQWKNGHNRFKELHRRGVTKFQAAVAAGSPTGFWRMSGHPAVQQALRNPYFDGLCLPRLYVAAQA